MLRLYSGTSLVTLTVCAGCQAIVLRGDKVVLRSDDVLFCSLPCAIAHDDAVIEPKAVAS